MILNTTRDGTTSPHRFFMIPRFSGSFLFFRFLDLCDFILVIGLFEGMLCLVICTYVYTYLGNMFIVQM